MKTNIKFFKYFLIVFFLSTFYACNFFAAGSYPYAERYELNYPEKRVKKAIQKFKLEYPEYNVPKVTINKQGSFDLTDEQTKDPNYWFKFFFYRKSDNKILCTWTRPSKKNTTTFAFVAINNGLDIGNWRQINNDFGSLENERQKEKFEKEILSKIKENLKLN